MLDKILDFLNHALSLAIILFLIAVVLFVFGALPDLVVTYVHYLF